MPPNAQMAGTLIPATRRLSSESRNTTNAISEDTRLRVPVETLAPDNARRRGVAMIVRHCGDCGGYAHLFRASHHAASYERNLPCTGRRVVLVAASFHLREVVA